MVTNIRIDGLIYKDITNHSQPDLVFIPTSEDYLGNLNCMMFNTEKREVLGIYSLKKADIETGRFVSIGSVKMNLNFVKKGR